MTVTAMPKNETEADPKKRRPVRLIAFVVVLAVAAAAGWFLVLAPGKDPNAAPEPGVVQALDSLQINLADGHYLRVGIALELTKEAGEEVETPQALNAEIDVFSGLTMAQVMAKGARDKLKDQLLVHLKDEYDGKVMGVYFTEFVTQ